MAGSRRRAATGIAAALMAAGCGTGVGARQPAQTTDAATRVPLTSAVSLCSDQRLKPLREHPAGPAVRCLDSGVPAVVVGRWGRLRLRTLTARLVGIRVVTVLRDPTIGRVIRANGAFVVVTLRIGNRDREPQQVVPIAAPDRAWLVIDGAQYSQDTDAEGGGDVGAFANLSNPDGELQPGEAAMGDVVFDVPARRAEKLGAGGPASLYVFNFGLRAGARPTQVGRILLGGEGGPGER